MAILLSDTFNGATASAVLNGRVLDNGIGGSGTRTWQLAAGANTLAADGADQIRSIGQATEQNGVSLGGEQNGIARFKFNCTTSVNVSFSLFGKGSQPAAYLGTASIYASFSPGVPALRLRNQNGTDLVSTSVPAIQTNTIYYLELEVNSATAIARVRNDDLSIRNTVSYTYASGSPFGNFWGIGTVGSANQNYRIDDFYMTDLDGAGATASVAGIKGSVFRSSVFNQAVFGNGVMA